MKLRTLLPVLSTILVSAISAYAGPVTLTSSATALSNAITSGNTGITVTSATLSNQTSGSGVASTGTFTNIYGLSSGAVISTGNAGAYGSGPNNSANTTTSYGVLATPTQNALLNPLTVPYTTHYDVTQLNLSFTANNPALNKIFFNVAFGSEEFPEFVGSSFVDAFGLYLNGVNIAFTGANAVNINNPCFTAFAGTELDGVLACGGNPISTFSGNLIAGTNTLTFIIADTSDANLDTTAYISSLGTTPISTTPEPSSLALLGTGVLSIGAVLRRRLLA